MLLLDPTDAKADRNKYGDVLAFVPPNVTGLVRNERIAPHWIGRTNRFWYLRHSATGTPEFRLVDPDVPSCVPAFDHEAFADRIDTISHLEFSEDLSEVRHFFRRGQGSLDRRSEILRSLENAQHKPELRSPDGRLGVYCDDHNLWLQGEVTRQLTFDGEAHFAYGKLPDTNSLALLALRKRFGLPPFGIIWSLDSRFLISSRIDERQVPPYPFIEATPDATARPQLFELRRALLSDRDLPVHHVTVIEIATGDQRRIELPGHLQIVPGSGTCWWSGKTLFAAACDPAYQHVALLALDLETRAVRVVVEELVSTHHDFNLDVYRAPNIRVLGDGREVVWFSEREGWAHLYLHDGATGALIRPLTHGSWIVNDIIHVDEAGRALYVTGMGREPGHHPHHRHLYRLSFDGGEPILLTPEDADHNLHAAIRPQESVFGLLGRPSFSPNHDCFVETFSTLSEPPVTVLRSTEDGRILLELERADTSKLDALGYDPPVPVTLEAADGETDLCGVIYFPPGFDPTGCYPVIDAAYGAPQKRAVKYDFMGALWDTNPPAVVTLARLGFIVVQIDGRGSAQRDKAFHDVAYGRFHEGGLDDHIAGLRQLGARYPAMDLSRVGIYGYSLGAYYAVRAVLAYPQFYKASVGIGGGYDFAGQQVHMIQKWNGPVTPGEAIPAHYGEGDLAQMADRLQGKLLLITTDVDEMAPLGLTLRLADRLIKADKDFDLLVMPGLAHLELSTHPYVLRRLWDFFLKHLIRCS